MTNKATLSSVGRTMRQANARNIGRHHRDSTALCNGDERNERQEQLTSRDQHAGLHGPLHFARDGVDQAFFVAAVGRGLYHSMC